jgi:hypothetical protein
MPHELVAPLLSAAVATLVTFVAVGSAHRAHWTWTRRMAMPLLWIASRDFQSTFSAFSSRTNFGRATILVLWFYLFLLALLVMYLLVRLGG